MNEYLTSEEKRGRPYGVLVCFVPRATKERYVRAAKMRKGRTISAFIREAMELLIRVEERLLNKIELLTYEYAESEFLNVQLRPQGKGSEAIDPSSLVEERKPQKKADEQAGAVSATSTWEPGHPNPILAFIEAKKGQRSAKLSRQ